MLQNIFKTIILLSFTFGQITDFNLTIDSRNVTANQNLYLKKLTNDLEFYILSNDFLNSNQGLTLLLDANITIESISNNNIISAYVLFSNRGDQLLFSDGVDFKYMLGENLIYSTTYNSLTSFIDYNIFIMIASELDKYNYKGGEDYYIRAQDIALKGSLSEYPRKWSKRLKKCKEIKENTYLRNIKYLYTNINNHLDNTDEEIDDKFIIESLETIYDKILYIDDDYGYNKGTALYLSSIKETFTDLCLEYDMTYIIIFLSQYDKDNSQFYKEIID